MAMDQRTFGSLRQTAVTLVLLALLFCCSFFLQRHLTAIKPSSWTIERMTYLPRAEEIKKYLFGFESVYADYLWIKTGQYIGTHYTSDKDFRWMTKMIDMVTKINPRFTAAYEVAGVLIPDLCRDPVSARIILDRGLSYADRSKKWKIAFNLGVIYLQFYGRKDIAAQYFELATKFPSAHRDKLTTIAASMYTQAGEREQEREFLVFMYESAEDPAVKQRVRDRLRERFPEVEFH